MKRYHIFITNDDGIDAPGIRSLIEFVKPFGYITIVAPTKGHSGQSHAVTVGTPIRLNKITEEHGYREFSCTGTPVDCVKIGLQQLCEEPPDIVISGINHGSNAGINLFYSGTMAAASEGTINGIPSIGFSLCNYSHSAIFNACKEPVQEIMKSVIANPLPHGVTLNVNIPDIPAEKIKGLKNCRMGNGRWVEEFEKRTDPHGRDYYWLTGRYKSLESEEDTDHWALDNGYVSVVPLTLDMTHHTHLQNVIAHV